MADNPFFRYNVFSNPVLTGDDKGISQVFPSRGDVDATRGSELGRSAATIADVFGDLFLSPIRIGGAGLRDAGLGIYDFFSQPSSTIDPYADLKDAKLAPEDKGEPSSLRNLSKSDFELRAEEDEGLIDSDIQKEINKLTNQTGITKDATKGATKGATDPNVSSDVAPEDEGLPSDIIKTDTTKADETKTGTGTGGLTPEEQLMKSGMDSYIAALGEDVEVGSIEDYKKEFEKATGIDASGKVDKSMALTALGLALMQNKAGKGFNVGNILSEVGKAGEKALPALEKAKSEAKAGQLAAGKYALGQRQKDLATNQAKSQDIANKIFEINKMSIGQSFDMQKLNQKYIYDLALQKQQLDDEIRIAQMTPEEYGDKYMSKATKIELLPELNIQVQLPDKNYKGPDKVSGALLTPIASIAKELNTREKSYTKLEDELKEVNAIAQAGGTTIPAKLQSLGVSWAKAFGMAKGMDNPTKRAQYILKTIQAGNAALILGEAGKTISDRDRALVEDFVGTISLKEIDSGDPAFLAEKLQKVFELTVQASRNSLDRAYIELGQYGYNLGPMAEKLNAANQIVD
tara:strand:- start:2903 stop:4627 length:1725 start_codon:yes stop_codon:yes gene_type:complete